MALNFFYYLILSKMINQEVINIDNFKQYGIYINQKMVDSRPMEYIVIKDVKTYKEILKNYPFKIDSVLTEEYKTDTHIFGNVILFKDEEFLHEATIFPLNEDMLLDYRYHVGYIPEKKPFGCYEYYRDKAKIEKYLSHLKLDFYKKSRKERTVVYKDILLNIFVVFDSESKNSAFVFHDEESMNLSGFWFY